MMKFQNLYVAATSQHVGKTTSTLGLVAAFRQQGLSVGYCKPVGQQFLDIGNMRVDKDALLFSHTLGFELSPNLHSPVILGRGATTAFLDNPTHFGYKKQIAYAAKKLTKNNELVVFEGTGHPGVGSVVNLSNADVAHLLKAKVIIVAEGGVGNTIDRLALCISLFKTRKVPILGIIVNKVTPDKTENVRHYVGNWLKDRNIPLLGIVPYEQSLGYPLLKTATQAVDGQAIYHEDQLLKRKVAGIIGSSIINDPNPQMLPDQLLIVSMRRVDEAIHKIKLLHYQKESPLVGIMATADGTISQESLDYINQYQIPLIRTKLDTYGAVIKINRIEVKINTNTPWKVERAIQMVNDYVDINGIMKELKI